MGSRYTTEENNRLMKFIKDHDTVSTNAELARMLKSYGMFTERSDRALEIQIGKLKNPQKAEPSFDSIEQMTFDVDPLTAIMESDYRKVSEKYESLLHAVLGMSEPYRNPKTGRITGRFTFDFNAITDWLYQNEPRRVNAFFEDKEER